MYESVRIKTSDEQTAVTAQDLLARFHPRLVHEDDEPVWEVQLDSEADGDLPDILTILRERLHAPSPSIDVLIDGEPYAPRGES